MDFHYIQQRVSEVEKPPILSMGMPGKVVKSVAVDFLPYLVLKGGFP